MIIINEFDTSVAPIWLDSLLVFLSVFGAILAIIAVIHLIKIVLRK